eukprot:607522-Pyramimonas_sp.AAC.1
MDRGTDVVAVARTVLRSRGDPHAVLGVMRGCSAQEVRGAYRKVRPQSTGLSRFVVTVATRSV